MSSYTVLFDKPAEADVAEAVFSKEMFKLLDTQMPVPVREDWIRFINDLKITKVRRQKILDEISNILRENNIDPETW